MSNSRKCPICENTGKRLIKHIHNIVPEGWLLPYGTDADLVMCSNCGFIYHDVLENPNTAAYYSSYTGEGGSIVKEDEKELNSGCVDFLCRNGLKPENSLLDIGCSYGVLLSLLKEKGFKHLYGLDEDRAAVSYLRSKGLEARTGSIMEEGPQEFQQKFDVIVLRFILEHLYNPREAVRNAERWLKPGGSLMIVLPDLSSYYEAGPFPGYYAEFEHINHFTLISAVNLMKDWDLRAYEKDSRLYPLMRTIFSKKENPIKRVLCEDENGLQYFERHLNEPNDLSIKIMDAINGLKMKQTELAIWGGGNFVCRLMTHTSLKDCNIKYIVDKNEILQGKILHGVTIMSPADFSKENFTGFIVISGKNSIESIKEDIRTLNLKNPVICLSQ